jgi:hypothetical protein
MNKRLMTIILSSLFLFGCAVTLENAKKENQVGFVFVGNENGNKIVVPNLDGVPAFNIYRQSEKDTGFIFITKVTRFPLPLRYQPTPYGIEWVDSGNTKTTKYRVEAIDYDNKIWCEMKLIYDQNIQQR